MKTQYNTLEDFLNMLKEEALKGSKQTLIGNAILTGLSWKYNVPNYPDYSSYIKFGIETH